MEGADGTSIKTIHLACTWRTKMKGEESTKGEGGNRRRGSRNQEKNIVALRTGFVIKPERNIYIYIYIYIKQISLDFTEDDFLWHKPVCAHQK